MNAKILNAFGLPPKPQTACLSAVKKNRLSLYVARIPFQQKAPSCFLEHWLTTNNQKGKNNIVFAIGATMPPLHAQRLSKKSTFFEKPCGFIWMLRAARLSALATILKMLPCMKYGICKDANC